MNRMRLAMLTAVVLANPFGILAAQADDPPPAESAWVALPGDLEPDLSDPLLRHGQSVYIQRCAGCHDAIPQTIFGPPFLPPMPGTQVLRGRYGEALPAELHRRSDLPADYIEFVVRRGLGSMPFFRPTEISADDLRALVAYLTRPRGAGAD